VNSPDHGRGQVGDTAALSPVRVAVDLLGGDGAPDVVTTAVADWLARPGRGAVSLTLVGPETTARAGVAAAGADPDHPALSYAAADRAVAMVDAPVAAVRTHRDLGVRVAAELVRDGAADAIVSAGHTGALVVATSLVWGRRSSAARPALAVLVPATAGPVLLLDVGASPDATPEVLVSHAALGVGHLTASGLVAHPRVGLLNLGAETGKGDALRRGADPLLHAAFGTGYVGQVEGHDLSAGALADVVVTDGFTGNVALKAMEGAVRWATALAASAYPDPAPALAAVRGALHAPYGAGLLLGVRGTAVAAHGATSGQGLRAAITLAATVAGRTATTVAAMEPGGATP
jgi:phosphate acyltransferase